MPVIATEARSVYSQAVQTVWAHPILYGSFSIKKVKSKFYVYHQYTSGGIQKQTYLAEADAEMKSKVESWRSTNKYLQRLAAMAIHGGCLAGDRTTEMALMRFAEAGWFNTGGVLVGSQAFIVLGNVMGVRWGNEAIITQDLDLSAARSVAVAIQPQLGRTIEEMGYFPVPPLNHKNPPTSYILRGGKVKIDILTPETGKPMKAPAYLDSFGVAAQPVRFLDYLMEDTMQAAYLATTAVAVRIPSPGRFAFHKLITAGRRGPAEENKAAKDILQAESLFLALLENRPGEIDLAFRALRKLRWHSHIQPGLSRLKKGIRTSLNERISG